MNKIELINELNKRTNITKAEAKFIINTFFDNITDTLAKGERVEIRGLCSFFVKKYKGYQGRNPKTGKVVTVNPKKLPFFKVGKELRDRVNQKSNRK